MKLPDPNETIFTKDATMLHDLLQNLQALEQYVQAEMASHGHTKCGSLALVLTYQEIDKALKQVERCAETLPQEAKESINLLIAGVLNED